MLTNIVLNVLQITNVQGLLCVCFTQFCFFILGHWTPTDVLLGPCDSMTSRNSSSCQAVWPSIQSRGSSITAISTKASRKQPKTRLGTDVRNVSFQGDFVSDIAPEEFHWTASNRKCVLRNITVRVQTRCLKKIVLFMLKKIILFAGLHVWDIFSENNLVLIVILNSKYTRPCRISLLQKRREISKNTYEFL